MATFGTKLGQIEADSSMRQVCASDTATNRRMMRQSPCCWPPRNSRWSSPLPCWRNRFPSRQKNDWVRCWLPAVTSGNPWLISSGEAYLAGVRFLSDRRALVPRSPIAQLLTERLYPWWTSNGPPRHIVDVCCGGGSLGIVAATCFPEAAVTLSDLDRSGIVARRGKCSL